MEFSQYNFRSMSCGEIVGCIDKISRKNRSIVQNKCFYMGLRYGQIVILEISCCINIVWLYNRGLFKKSSKPHQIIIFI